MSAWGLQTPEHQETQPDVPPPSERPGRSRAPFGMTALALIVVVAAVAGGISGAIVASVSDEPGQAAVAPAATVTPTGTPATPPALPDIPAIIAKVRQSVVTIDVTYTVTLGPRTVTAESAGTGFVLTSDGMIATNAHVIEDARSISVMLPDGTSHNATLVGQDSVNDLAVVKIEVTGLTPMPLGKSAVMRVGDMVIAVGNALALEGGPTASMGIVSALNRTITASDGSTLSHLIQTDAAINEGDSGGPLTNGDGELIGINTIGSSTAENIGFAIAIDHALPLLENLEAGGR